MRILITGATGLVGCHAAAAIADAGHEVRALVRDASKLARVMEPFGGVAAKVEAAVGDLATPASVEAALEGCDAVVHSAGLFSHALADAEKLERTNVEGTRVVLEAALGRGLDPVIHVSSMLALFPPRGDRIRADDPVTSPRAMYSSTKARAERIAREWQAKGAPVVTVYPASVQGPHDPTVGSGPEVLRNQLRGGKVLVTEGGLAYVDARDLGALLAALLERGQGPRKILSTASFVEHAELYRLLCRLTGRELGEQKIPGGLLRAIGTGGDWVQRLFGRDVQLTSESAMVLTRSVPYDDGDARRLLGREPIAFEQSLRDLLVWMHETGVLKAKHVGRLAEEASAKA